MPEGNPREASAAEMPSRPISVAVSKPSPKSTPERIHVPAAADHGEHGAEKAGEQSAAGKEQVEIFVDVGRAVRARG